MLLLPVVLGALAFVAARLARPGEFMPLATAADRFWVGVSGWSVVLLLAGGVAAIPATLVAAFAAVRYPKGTRLRAVSFCVAGLAVAYVTYNQYQRATAAERFRERMEELRRRGLAVRSGASTVVAAAAAAQCVEADKPHVACWVRLAAYAVSG